MMSDESGSQQLISFDQFERCVLSETQLPQNIGNILLRRYLKVYDDKDLNKSLDLLKFNLTLRKQGPMLFTNRDPLSDETQIAFKTVLCCPLPKLLGDNKITIISLINYDISQFDYVQVLKMVLMLFDARFTQHDDSDGNIACGECFIIDSKGMSFKHFLNVVKNFTSVRLYMKYIQEAAPFNIKKIHFINTSYIIDKMFALIRPLLKKELLEVIYFHRQGPESLYEHVPKAYLPSEFGGELESIHQLHKKFLEFVINKRDYLGNDDNWKISDS